MKKELDYRNLQCPEPVIRARAVIAENHPEALDIRVDNQAAVENVSRFLKRSGYDASSFKAGENEWVISAVKNKDAALVETEETGKDGKTLVLITTETMGRGDDGLGAKLMENFLATLPELGPALWRIVLLNGGVKLAATPGNALNHLKELEASGVSIFVCGTCLTHYDLLQKKAVGETTNMLDIVTSMGLAGKVIRP